MAILTNTKYATFDKSVWQGKSQVTVGHNRTLELGEDWIGARLTFRLHGHAVVTFWKMDNDMHQLKMDDCGYPTTTTRSAITDAANLFGFAGGVSFAKGGFKPRLSVTPYSDANGFTWLEPKHVTSNEAVFQWLQD